MKHTFEEYLHLFPSHKRLSRSKLLCEASEMAASSISEKIRDLHGDDNAVSSLIGSTRSENYVSNYVENLVRFKMENEIGPKNRVEPSKIAAILIRQLCQEPITDMFSFKEKYAPGKSAYPIVVRGTFFNRLAYAYLGLPRSFVTEGLGQDLHRILVTEDVSNERLMSVLFKGVFWARGVEADCLKD